MGKKQNNNSSLFTFRRYKKKEGGKKPSRHPKLIVDETKTDYGFMGLTKDDRRGHHKNIELKQNPQKGNPNKAYLRDELRYDDKVNFDEELKQYNLSPEDKRAIIELIKRRKKKK